MAAKNNMQITLSNRETIFALYGQYGLIRGVTSFRNNFMINNIKITNTTDHAVKLESCELIFKANNKIIQSTFLDSDWIKTETEQALKYIASPVAKELVLRKDFYSGDFVATLELKPRESLLIYNQYFDIYAPNKIDALEIKCSFNNSMIAQNTFSISEYKPKNKYILPMKGAVAIIGGPYEIWGHRTMLTQEFGIDLVVLDEELKPYSSNPLEPANHYCFGKDVLAPADGTIVEIADGLPDNTIPYDPKNTGKQFEEARSKFPLLQAAGGNYIVIDHGDSEYSQLAHLKNGSIKVKRGEHVKQGRIIAECGNSGRGSTSPHLHFHLMDKPILSEAISLPIKFENTESTVFADEILKRIEIPEEAASLMTNTGVNLIRTK